MNNASEAPFARLGGKLKTLRQRLRESLAEAAGAVEIAEEELQQIEEGKRRPSEEILLLLINHFGMKEDEAVHLWEMAGYDAGEDDADDDQDSHTKTVVMAIAMDPRVMYSDSVQVNGSKHGVVLSFMQPGGGSIPAMPISRIGMSREQARKLAEILRDSLDQLDKADQPKRLSAENSNQDKHQTDQ